MKFSPRCLALVAALLVLSGCKAFDKQEPPLCPHVSALADTVSLTRLAPNAGQDASKALFKAEITGYHGSCRYDAEEKRMLFTLNLDIDVQRLPAMADRHADLAYYIAIPAFYPNPEGKKIMPIGLDFSEGSNWTHVTESDIELSIPMPSDPKELGKYEVFLGLQLTPDEVAFNRAKRNAR
jgi:hypothetical protein